MTTQVYTDGVTLTSAAELDKFDTAAYPQLTGVAGTNTITATGPANLGLATSPPLWFIPANTNTGATTLNITPSGGAALTAKNVFSGGAACVGGELVAGVPAAVVYDGTQYNLLNPAMTRGTFTASLTGCTTVPTVTAAYSKMNNTVVLVIPAMTATSNATTMTITGLPAAIQPASPKDGFPFVGTDNGSLITNPARAALSGGTLTCYINFAGTPWTNVNAKGISVGMYLTYDLT